MSNTQSPQSDEQSNLGLHLMLEAYEADAEKLKDTNLIFEFLRELPKKMNMNQPSAPEVHKCIATETSRDPGGLTGLVSVENSRLSMHTFPERGFLCVDLYLPEDFTDQIETILAYTKSLFDFKSQEFSLKKHNIN